VKSFDFKFGTAVYGRETYCGHLARLVIDPESQCLTELIVESGLLFKQSTVVPVSEVEEATTTHVRLAVGCQEMAGYPAFSEMTVEHPDYRDQSWVTPVVPIQESTLIGVTGTGMVPTAVNVTTIREKVRQGVSEGKIVLGNKTPVYGMDGRIGHLHHLITVNNLQECQIQYLVVTQGILLPKHFMIPIDYVKVLSEQGMHLLISDTELGEFPEYYAPPAEITEEPDVSERSM
jgi:hypothetical protein